MFDDLLESTNERRRRQIRVGVSYSQELCRPTILAILILIPLIYTEALPKAMLSTLLIRPRRHLRLRHPRLQSWKTIIKPVARLITSGKLMQPRAIPKEVAVFKEAELPPDVITNSWGDRRRVWGHSGAGHGCCHGSATSEGLPLPRALSRAVT